MSILTAAVSRLREALGIEWIIEVREIAEQARRQREEDEARAHREPHDMSRWMRDPREYRRPRPEGHQ